MRMTDYIKDLLYRYECVIIPEFGAFLTKRQSARIHESSHTFYPPKKKISFNRQLKENDGLLANYIAEVDEISYEQSLKKIYNFVENLNEALESHNRVTLDNVGMFYNQGDKILFQPSLHTNYLLDAFGASSFTSEEISREEKVEQKTAQTKIFTPQVRELELHPETGQESNVAAQTRIGSRERTPQRSAFWRYAAVGIVAVGLGGFLTANWYSNEVKSHNLAAQQEAEYQIENRIQQATFAINDPLPSVKFKVKAKRGEYHIVAGAFRQEKNALKQLEILKEQDFPAKYIGENKYGWHQVIYDSYEDRSDALKELYKVQREDNNPGAWLLVQNLKSE